VNINTAKRINMVLRSSTALPGDDFKLGVSAPARRDGRHRLGGSATHAKLAEMCMTKAWRVVAFALLLGACAPERAPTPAIETEPPDFVDVRALAPDIVVEMRYAGADNFVGRPVAGYEAPVCLLSRDAATALAAVHEHLRASGRAIKVYDCYRPTRAVADFAAWARDLGDQRTKAEYYPNIDKTQLFELGYIAERSGHSRGSTVDVTIVDRATGAEVHMGTPYDLFDPRSWPSDESVGATARENRRTLAAAMRTYGFVPLQEEWWHFTLENEPHPDTYFDVPVR
jgi:D-alanyl-D-alanine dipeptidase